jgi:hypothetical protein
VILTGEIWKFGKRWKEFPDAKGIEPAANPYASTNSLGWKEFPDAKGIETSIKSQSAQLSAVCWKDFPDVKGIET